MMIALLMKRRTSAMKYLGLLISLCSLLSGCAEYTPKPYGYPRIHFPERGYIKFTPSCHYSFEIPTYALMELDTHETAEPCWYQIRFPYFDATIYLTYKPVENEEHLYTLSEEAYKLAMKNRIKADVINEIELSDSFNGNQGVLYELYGETATPFNFYVTDQKNHYLRGAFYFDQYTKTDSVAPVFDFLKVDIMHMIKTLEWK